jgi:hypothetical protein
MLMDLSGGEFTHILGHFVNLDALFGNDLQVLPEVTEHTGWGCQDNASGPAFSGKMSGLLHDFSGKSAIEFIFMLCSVIIVTMRRASTRGAAATRLQVCVKVPSRCLLLRIKKFPLVN